MATRALKGLNYCSQFAGTEGEQEQEFLKRGQCGFPLLKIEVFIVVHAAGVIKNHHVSRD